MIDIISIGTDIGFYDTQTTRAQNILQTQQGVLEYAQDFGVDLKYFLNDEFRFQNASFKAYLIQRLAAYSINVASLDDTLELLYRKYTFNLTPSESTDSLIAR